MTNPNEPDDKEKEVTEVPFGDGSTFDDGSGFGQ